MSGPLIECSNCGAALDEGSMAGPSCTGCGAPLPLAFAALRHAAIARGARRLLVRPGGLNALFGGATSTRGRPSEPEAAALDGLPEDQRERLLRWADAEIARRQEALMQTAQRTLLHTVVGGLVSICVGSALILLFSHQYRIDVPVNERVKSFTVAPWQLIGLVFATIGAVSMVIGYRGLRGYPQKRQLRVAQALLLIAVAIVLATIAAAIR